MLNLVKHLAIVSWRKLLGEAKASFVATDAFIPRRPSARFFVATLCQDDNIAEYIVG